MFSLTARYYDAIYSIKDYAAEAATLRRLIAREHPGARTILDVACGTAEHARHLGEFQIDGIDLEPEFVEIARAKIPSGTFTVADMRDFHLGKRYDVVQCLFSSIGYVVEPEGVIAALKCFREHLAPGGVILVEPWLSPAALRPQHVQMLTVDRPDLKICRMGTLQIEGNISLLHFHYLIAEAGVVRQARETHRLALVPTETLASYFTAAGLEYTYDPVGVFDRGLFTARVPG